MSGRTPANRTVGPRTSAAQRRRTARQRALVIALVVILVATVGWFVLRDNSGGGSDAGPDQPGASAPAAPAKDQLRSGDWLLESYRFNNTGDQLSVSGTVRDTGDATASAALTVWVYQGQESLGSVSTTVSDVPAGGAVDVTMTGDAVFKMGPKVVLLEAS